MAKVELSRDLSLSPEEAWEHASNLSELGDWLQMHEGWRGEVPTELTVGTTIVGVAGAKGMRNRVKWTVRELDPPRMLAITGDGVGGTKYALKMSVAPTTSGCSSPSRSIWAASRCSGRSGWPPPGRSRAISNVRSANSSRCTAELSVL